MTVQCIYCRENIELNEDSEETRRLRTDPHQQMRRHIVTRHAGEIMGHTQKLGWLLDTLFFDSPEDPQRWLAQIVKLIQHHYGGSGSHQPNLTTTPAGRSNLG